MSTDSRFGSEEQAPEGLYGRVIGRVQRARVRAARVRVGISSALMAVSSVGSFLAVRATAEAANASGFTSFASLALTDTSIIALHARTFAFSLIETLPGFQVASVLLGVSILLVSLRSLVRALSGIPGASGVPDHSLPANA